MMPPGYKLGKRPARPRPTDLRFSNYRVGLLPIAPVLPPPPAGKFGHELLVPTWGVLGNDTVGDCAVAGAAHETMLWTAEGKNPAPFNDECVIKCYSEITGYDPSDPSTDTGCDMHDVLNYRRQVGLLDANGNRHKIGAYLALDIGNIQHLLEALYLFSAVGVGIQFPDTAMEQFHAAMPWDLPGGTIEGGHYVPLVGRNSRQNLVCVTWGRLQAMTLGFYTAFAEEAWAILSPEFLSAGVSPEGFDLDTLNADLAAVTAA
jgi:hypothetical protein